MVGESNQNELEYLKDAINKRTERLEELKRRSAEQGDADPARWKAFRDEKAAELRRKLDAAAMQAEQGLKQGMAYSESATDFKDAAQEVAEKVKVRGEEFVKEAADKARTYEEKLANTKDFAYDAVYAWKQKAGEFKDAGKDAAEKAVEVGKEKLDEIKENAGNMVDSIQSKVGDLKDVAQERVFDLKETVQEKASSVKEVLQERAADVREVVQERVADVKEKVVDMKGSVQEKAVNLNEAVQEKAADAKEIIQEKATDLKEAVQEKAVNLKEAVQEKAADVIESVQYSLEVGKEALQDAQQKATEAGRDTLHAAQEKLEEVKEKAADIMDSVQSKIEDASEGAKEKAKEVIESAKDTVQHTYENVVGTAEGIAAGKINKRISQAEYDFTRRHGSPTERGQRHMSQAEYDLARRHETLPLSSKDDSKSEGGLASLLKRVKAGLTKDEQAREELSMQEEWSKVDLKEKADRIVRQLQLLGDDVVQEVTRRLGESDSCSERLQVCENKNRL